jgi:hypothetical protein
VERDMGVNASQQLIEQIEATVNVANGIDPQIRRQRCTPPPHPQFRKTPIRKRSQHASIRHSEGLPQNRKSSLTLAP